MNEKELKSSIETNEILLKRYESQLEETKKRADHYEKEVIPGMEERLNRTKEKVKDLRENHVPRNQARITELKASIADAKSELKAQK